MLRTNDAGDISRLGFSGLGVNPSCIRSGQDLSNGPFLEIRAKADN